MAFDAKLDAFKNLALTQGYDSNEVEAFVQMARASEGAKQEEELYQPQTDPVLQRSLALQGAKDQDEQQALADEISVYQGKGMEWEDLSLGAKSRLIKSGVPAPDKGVSETKDEALGVVDELLGMNTKPITGRLQIGGWMPGSSAQLTKAKYEQLKGLLSLEKRKLLKGSGTISDYESRVLDNAASALNRNLSDKDFRNELEKIKGVLGGPALPETPQGVSFTPGGLDLTKLDGLSFESTRKIKDGGAVDNKLINFLKDSEFLPIAGSIAGGFAGAGVASVGTGAAGAIAGKALQQGLKELDEPEEAELSDHAKVVLTEGLVDAAIGGVTFGLGKAGVLVLKKAIKEPLEAFLPKLVRRGLPTSPTKLLGFKRSFGEDFAKKVVETGIPESVETAFETGKAGLKQASVKLEKILSKAKPVKTSKLVSVLSEVKPENISPNLAAGVQEIDKWIDFVKGYGDEVAASQVNTVKKGLQEAFGASLEVTKGAKKMVAGASRKVRKFIEEFHPEVAGTNKELRFNRLLKDAGEKQMTTEKQKSFWRLSDLVFVASGRIDLGAAVKALDAITHDPLQKARVIKNALEVAQETGDKNWIRNILRLAWRAGVTFTAGETTKEITGENELPSTPQQFQQDPGLGIPQDFFSR